MNKKLFFGIFLLIFGAVACSSEGEPTPQGVPLTLSLAWEGADEELIFSSMEESLSFRLTANRPATEEVEIRIDHTLTAGNDPRMEDLSEVVTHPTTLQLGIGEQILSGLRLTIDGSKLEFDQPYLLSLTATVVAGNGSLSDKGRIDLRIIRQKGERTMRQILFLEVNNCNPLNALEYRLANGSPFFDAVVLFAANINYNHSENRVYLHTNPNVQALLDHSNELLQPLREAGIKVYLGLLGNHDMAGLAQLSPQGAHLWAQEVAEVCFRYGLDGVNLDDEYSTEPDLSNPWFTSRSSSAGARLAYELKTALREHCPWPTEVSIFEYGALKSLPAVVIDGITHPQSEFIDILIPDYASSSLPYGDLTYAHCTGDSLELNHRERLPEHYAQRLLDQGYGWCMWFGFDPSGTGSVASNLEFSMSQFEVAARVFYGEALSAPEYLYHKLGEGSFDPHPHPIP